MENYIRWRIQLCNTLCFWTFLSSDLASGPFSQSIVYGQKLHNLTWFLIVFSGYPIVSYPLAIPSSAIPVRVLGQTSALVFHARLCCSNLVVVSTTLDLINTLPRLTCSWSVLVVSLIRLTGFGAFLIQRYVGLPIKPRRSSPRRHVHGGLSDDSS